MNQYVIHGMQELKEFLDTGDSSDLSKVVSQAEQYQNVIEYGQMTFTCKHGHAGCAAWVNGPCNDEIQSKIEDYPHYA